MQTFEPLQLSDTQKQILTAYGNACTPTIYAPGKRVPSGPQQKDLEFLKRTGLVDQHHNHISDRGAAYLFTQCGFPFDKFVKIHHWQERLASRIIVAKQIAESPEGENYYHLKRYELLIKYNSFGGPANNAEAMPANLGEVMTELFESLIKSDLFKWEKLKDFLISNDIYADEPLKAVDSKAAFVVYIERARRALGG